MSGQHISKTDYRRGSTRRLVNYIDRDENHELKNRAGQTMTDEEREIFNKRSEYHEFERHIILSPDSDEYSEQEVEAATRDSINSYFEDAETVDFCYSVHHDEQGPHTHVALTGDADELSMYPDDLQEFREQSEERFLEREQTLHREIMRENGFEREQEREHQQERGHSQRR